MAKKLSLVSRIKKAKKDAEKARQKAVKEGEKLFREAVKEIFKGNKKLERFAWNQYTPYFNDGSECFFGVHFDSLAINDEIGSESEDIWTLESIQKLLKDKTTQEARIIMELSGNDKKDGQITQLKHELEVIRTRDPEEVMEKFNAKRAILDLLENIDTDTYKYMFGDGTVVVTREDISVEECEHD